MAVTRFRTQNETYRKLMSNGLTYSVPRFQRDYSWTEDEWEDLWHDILAATAPGEDAAHYLGYLVLRSEDDRHFEIIDGQQRLTTLSLLVLAGLRRLQKLFGEVEDQDSVRRRLDSLRLSYIGYEDPVTLVSQPKLRLNRNNDAYYRNYLVSIADPLPKRGFKRSEHLLRKAFEWFDARLRTHLQDEPDPGRAIAELVSDMSDRLFFTVITVTDELNAYTVFETLNARGVRLSATDLLKNYLFALLHREQRHETELRTLDDRWDRLLDRIGAESVPDFTRTHWMSRHPLVRRSDLFKTIRKQVTTPAAVFELLRNMETDLDPWLALIRPQNHAADWDPAIRRNAELLYLFGVRQPLPLLLAAHRRLDANAFRDLLRAIGVLSFRYNVIGNGQTSDQERGYSAAAQQIERGKYASVRDILGGLRTIYPDDEEFRHAFSAKSLAVGKSRNMRVARYLLGEIEHQQSGVRPALDDPSISLEHVCPVAGGSGWEHFAEPDLQAMAPRLGNMVLLKGRQNRALRNAPWETKKHVYARSGFESTRSLAETADSWTPEAIVGRQRVMAKLATSVWRIPQLD